ncbi:MAG: prepilin-type N-terminal cleavage/methylation domain-containing protein [Candidatus Magasanikbacteria bacterium]|nr:prepilin-type N-terminal cleavage/methylation domain-containing protein [Candidatus Magasanikbacteria bacterium]
MTSPPRARGFSLVELMLTVALIALLAGITLPVYRSYQTNSDRQRVAASLASRLRRAQTLATAVAGDSSWGVAVATGTITVFKGVDYANREAAFDEITDLPRQLTFSGLSEVVFARFSGAPLTTGEIRLTSSDGGAVSLTINSQGMISY